MRALLVSAALAVVTLVGPAATASVDGGGLPVEDYATYDPQTTCTKCTSEHKDGRAVDWTLDATSPADRQLARAFLAAAFATDADGNPAALARRMGIMYVIWNDHFYAAYEQFQPEAYLSSSCRSKRKCSKTLRHRDHMHLSLSKAGAKGLTSFYVDLVPAPPGA